MKTSWIIALSGLSALLFSALSSAALSTRGDGLTDVVNHVGVEQVNAMFGGVGPAGSGIVRVDKDAFQAGSGLITFSEFPQGTVNPSYTPASYGGDADNPDVTFAGFFLGQRLGTAAECPPGAAVTGCVLGTASAPIALDAASPVTFIVGDNSNPTSPVLSGSPQFNGPIAILFDKDQAGVGLDGGYFDNPHSTAITAFARDGSVLGSVTNEGVGIEFLGLVTADGRDTIAGLMFSLVGQESAGFAIDNLMFGKQGQVTPPGEPPPPPQQVEYKPVPTLNDIGLALLLVIVGGLGLVAMRR